MYDIISQGRPFPDEQTFCRWVREYYGPLEKASELGTPESAAYHTIVSYAHIPLIDDPTLLFEGETYIDVILEQFNDDLAQPGTVRYKALMREAQAVFLIYQEEKNMTSYETLAQGRALPDETTFREWLRVYCNDLIETTAYGSPELRAYESILGIILDTGADLEENETLLDLMKSDLWSETVEEQDEINRTLYCRFYELIESYQERLKTTLPLSGGDMGLIVQALGDWVAHSTQKDGHKPAYLAELEVRVSSFFLASGQMRVDYTVNTVKP